MPAQRLPATETVILGPCPGCSVWTLEYDLKTRASYCEAGVEQVYQFGSEEPVDEHFHLDDAPWIMAVEGVLQDHLDECPGLRELLS